MPRSVGTTVPSGGDAEMRAVPMCKRLDAEFVRLWILTDDSEPLLGSAAA